MFEFCKELLVHAHRTLGTLSVQDGPVLSFLESYPSLSMNFLGPLLLPGVYLVGSPSRSLKRTKSALLKSRLCPHGHCSQECLWLSPPQQASPCLWVWGPAEHLSALAPPSVMSGSFPGTHCSAYSLLCCLSRNNQAVPPWMLFLLACKSPQPLFLQG